MAEAGSQANAAMEGQAAALLKHRQRQVWVGTSVNDHRVTTPQALSLFFPPEAHVEDVERLLCRAGAAHRVASDAGFLHAVCAPGE